MTDPEEFALMVLAQRLIQVADRKGYVISIEQVPRKPLAMGNYVSVVTVQPKRNHNKEQKNAD